MKNMRTAGNPTLLDSAEWDFTKDLSGPQLTACWLYEYARESETLRTAAAEIKELRKKGWQELFQLPPRPRLPRKGKRKTYSKKLRAYEEAKKRRRALPSFVDAVVKFVRRHRITSEHYQGNLVFILQQPFFPETPWQRLSPKQQESIVKYPMTCQPVAPADVREFNSVWDALPLVIKEQTPKPGTPRDLMGLGFSVRPYVVKNGRETRPFTIDWAGSKNSEICAAFSKWVASRRKEIDIPVPSHPDPRRGRDRQGRGGKEDKQSHLFHLGVMRLLHSCRIANLARSYPKAASHWIESEKRGLEQYMNEENVLWTMNKCREDWSYFLTLTRSEKVDQSVQERFVDYHRRAAKVQFSLLFPFDRKPPRNWRLV